LPHGQAGKGMQPEPFERWDSFGRERIIQGLKGDRRN
jgi:hypothetical protein